MPPPPFFFQYWPLLLELQLPFIKDRPGARASLDGQTGVLGSVPKSPHVQGAMGWGLGVLIDNTQQPWAWGVTGKDGQSAEGAWVLVTFGCMVSAPCSCKRSQRNGTVSLTGFISERGREWNWITWSSVQVAQEEKCGSWIRHTCLYEAVCGSTAYLLWARSHYFTYAARMSLKAAPTSGFLHCRHPTDPPSSWLMIHAARH